MRKGMNIVLVESRLENILLYLNRYFLQLSFLKENLGFNFKFVIVCNS